MLSTIKEDDDGGSALDAFAPFKMSTPKSKETSNPFSSKPSAAQSVIGRPVSGLTGTSTTQRQAPNMNPA